MEGITWMQVTEDAQIQEVARLAGIIWREHYHSILEEAQIDYMLEKFQSPPAIAHGIQEEGYAYYLICLDGKPVGYTALVPEENTLFLSKIYLLREVRGRGAGKATVEFVRDRARTLGLPTVYLTVNRNNADSIAFYRHAGFVKVRTQVADIGSGYVMDDDIMELTV